MSQLASKILENDRLKELTAERQTLMMYINNIKDWESRIELKKSIQHLDTMIDIEILNIKKEIENEHYV